MDLVEVRNWLLFIGAIIGSAIALKSLFDNIKQRKLDNTFKVIEYLRKHISKEQIDTFIKLFDANNECAGIPADEFHFRDHIEKVENMFSEGGSGIGDLQNMIELFDLMSKELLKKTLIDELIWYEYGQIMSKCHLWITILNRSDWGQKFYPVFLEYVNKNKNYLLSLPVKHYVYLE